MNEATSFTGTLQSVPSVDLPPERLDERLIVGFDSYDNRSRPYNLLRTQLTKILDRTGDRLIGMTSATPAAGKTFTSVNLAAALSKMEGRKVVLCDFDLRRGSILKHFGVSVTLALDDYLIGEEQDWTNLLFRVNNNNLFVLPTRTVLRDSSEAVGSERFVALIEQLRALPEDFLVLCDLPPVFANDDAMLCMRHLDAYVLVIDHGRTTARQLEEATSLLEPARCLGTVLNRYQGGFGDDYGYGYGDTYGLKDYYADE